MKRIHIGLEVSDLESSIRFYSNLFGQEPSVREADYAKWMPDDPKVNFVLDQKCGARGVDHLGIQVDENEELDEVTARLEQAGENLLEQEKTQCCYAVSDKTWVTDPQGVDWETFKTHDLVHEYGDPRSLVELRKQGGEKKGCC